MDSDKEEIVGTALGGEDVPEGAIPLFKDSYGNTAYIKNVPNSHLPKSVSKSDSSPIFKSVREHRHLQTLAEARSFTKMSRPSETFKGSERPDLYSIEKSMADGRRCGGVTTATWTKDMGTSAIMKNDWEEYDRFRKRGRF